MNLWNYYDGDLKYPDLNNHSHEKEIAKTNSKWAFEYISKHGKDEDLEPAIAKNDGLYSYKYALYVLKGPFKLGEPTIAKHDGWYSYKYALYVLKGPFPLGEPTIAKNEFYSKTYTQDILKKDFYLDGKLICKYEG